MKYAFLFLLLLYIPTALAQENKPVQITGRITDELLQPLPFAHIFVLNNFKGTITDKDGKFSFVAMEADSLLFSSVGYRRERIQIGTNLDEPFLVLDVVLETDTFMIAEVEIYPWKTYEEFKEAFINLKLPDDDMERARRNIALIKTQIIMDQTPSARENYRHILDQQYRETYRQGTIYPTYQLFNVVAWAKFFEALKRGDFSKYEKDDQ